MKRSVIASGATALILGMVAVSAQAAENVLVEDFKDQNGNTIIGSNPIGTHSNLTWSVLDSGTADLSVVENEKLSIDTEGDTIAATIDGTKAATLNAALTGAEKPEKANGEIFLDAKVKFVPSDELETFAEDETLKFAIYAYEHVVGVDTVTNLVVYHKGGTSPACTNDIISNITFGPADGEKRVVVTMKDDSGLKFKVEVGGVAAESTLANEGWFPVIAAANNSSISAINIQGTGTIDDITLGYNTAAGFVPGTSNGVTVSDEQGAQDLTADEAAYLNANVDAGYTVDAIIAKVRTISSAKLDEARLLNLDVVAAADASSTYSFDVTGITVSGANAVVTVKLNRLVTALDDGAINGTLKIYTSADGSTFTETEAVALTNATFANGDVATITVAKSAGTIVKAKIE